MTTKDATSVNILRLDFFSNTYAHWNIHKQPFKIRAKRGEVMLKT